MFQPTHRHADGGFYQYVGPQEGKHPTNGLWYEGVAYRDEKKLYWTNIDRWEDRFTPLAELDGKLTVIDLIEDDEPVGSFIFKVIEAGDIRAMLMQAGPQGNTRIAPEQLQHIKRVLGAMAEAVAQGLHIRDHDFPDLLGDVNAFHAKYGQEYLGKPRALEPELFDFRVKFHTEETTEYADEQETLEDAINRRDRRDILNALELQLDALCDAIWVVLGTADLQFGRKVFFEAWRRVVKANMAKVRKDEAQEGHEDSGRAPKFDIVKPAGWEAPDHRDLLLDNAIFDEVFGFKGFQETNTFNEDRTA